MTNKKHMVTYIETADIYNKTVAKVIDHIDKQWILDIVDGISEQESIVYQDDDFIMLPDSSWNPQNNKLDDLYLLIIPKRKDIRSIRDLRGEHIPLLEKMLTIIDEIERIYSVPTCLLRSYFHYKPSTWHLHLHINTVNSSKPYTACVERAHSLVSVINNLKIDPDYYTKVDLFVGNYV